MAGQQCFTIIDFNPGNRTNAETLSKIRSHAMRQVRKEKKNQQLLAGNQPPSTAATQKNSSTRPAKQTRVRTALQLGPSSTTAKSGPPPAPILNDSAEREAAKKIAEQDLEDLAKLCKLIGVNVADLPERFQELQLQTPPTPQPGTVTSHESNISIELTSTIIRQVKLYYSEAKKRWDIPYEYLVQRTLTDPGLCHSLLALITAHAEHGQTERQLWHETGALQYLHWKLSSGNGFDTPDEVILAVSRLALANSFWAAEDAAVQHMIGIGSMVERRGGMEKLGFNGYVKFAIASCLLSNCIWFRRLPANLHYPYGRLLPDPYAFDERVQAFGRGTAFANPACRQIMSMEMQDILMDIADLNRSIDQSSATSTTTASSVYLMQRPTDHGLRLIYAGEEAIPEGFDRMHYSLTVDTRHPQREMEELLRLTSTIWVWILRRGMHVTTRPMIRAHNQIHAILHQVDLQSLFLRPETQPIGADLLLWLFVTLGTTAPSPEDRRQVNQFLRSYLPETRNMDWSMAKSVCRQFLWLESTCPTRCESFWTAFQKDNAGRDSYEFMMLPPEHPLALLAQRGLYSSPESTTTMSSLDDDFTVIEDEDEM